MNGEKRLKELEEFVSKAISKGLSKKKIEELLIEKGWPKDLVSRGFQKKDADKSRKGSEKEVIISLQDVSKRFDGKIVLDNANLAVKKGEILGIIGISGSGKTTMLNLIVGFLEPDNGDIVLMLPGEDVHTLYKQPPLVKKLFGFSSQERSFYLQLTVKENLEHFAALYGYPPAKQIEVAESLMDLLKLLDAKDTLAQNISGGMQKRLDIACALIHCPRILILDEPTADLDPIFRKETWSIIKNINRQGTTVILASHFLFELEELCTRVAVLDNHKIIETGTIDELRNKYYPNYEIEIKTKSSKYTNIIKSLKKERKFSITEMHEKEDRLFISTSCPEIVVQHLVNIVGRAKDRIVDVVVKKPTMKEIFPAIIHKK